MMNLRRHDIANQWCRYPRQKCTCPPSRVRGGPQYSRLSERIDEGWGEYHDEAGGSSAASERAEELIFYNHDDSFQSVVVEANLCASDLCQLLAIKNGAKKDPHWCIVETWSDLGLERVVEDHEYVLEAYKIMCRYMHIQFKYTFRKDFNKYEFFKDPLNFFPSGMLDVEKEEGDDNLNPRYIQSLVHQGGGHCPIIFSYVWVRDEKTMMWSKTYMILRDKKLFTCKKVSSLAKFFRSSKNKAITMISEDPELATDVRLFATLSGRQVYKTVNAKNQLRAPTEWGICLRPTGDNTADESEDTVCCLACESERVRTCWITAMRLAKYGKQLRENYRAFRNKQNQREMTAKDYESYDVPTESIRSRVAMDFTGAVGRIVEDPKEADAIAIAEGYSWKRRWRPISRMSAAACARNQRAGIEGGVHITQPWFHCGMTRDCAIDVVMKHGERDGSFLVRDSRSTPGAFVLTYKCGSKVIHAQINPCQDIVDGRPVYSLDNGVTRFYDLLQLVEFYQLNIGCLATKLSRYIICIPKGNAAVAQTADQDQQAHTSRSRNSSSGSGSN